jgi:putative SOS response-associated peptidase YedK
MCGRFSLRAKGSDLARLFDLADVPDLFERFNVAPQQPVAAVREDAGQRVLALLRWGLVPSWSQDARGGLINARSETADRLPAFRDACPTRTITCGRSGVRRALA